MSEPENKAPYFGINDSWLPSAPEPKPEPFSDKAMTLREAQSELHKAKVKAFAEYPDAILNSHSRALNICEEAGELAREERLDIDGFGFDEAKAKDAVSDIFASTLGYCIAQNWSAQHLLEQGVELLKRRWESGQLVGIPSSEE